MKNKFLKILASIMFPLMLSGCMNLNHNSSKYDDYNDNKSIANNNNHYNTMYWNGVPPKNVKVGKFDGHCEILEANLDKDIETVLHIRITATQGKGKIVLVKPNSEVEILAEAISEENKNFEGDISIKCTPGNNKIKIVGKNYGGNFEIQQPNEIMFNNITTENKIEAEIEDKINDNMDDMFGENFPFEANTH